MISGYPPVLPPLQGPVDGIVSMGSMQPLHPGVPPPHQLPPGMPGIPGIPPPGKSLILIPSLFHCHVLGLTHCYRSSLQLVLVMALVCEQQHCWIWGVCKTLTQQHGLRERVLEKCGAVPAVLFQPKKTWWLCSSLSEVWKAEISLFVSLCNLNSISILILFLFEVGLYMKFIVLVPYQSIFQCVNVGLHWNEPGHVRLLGHWGTDMLL